MTRNKMIDLNNHLFEQLEKLNDGDLEGYQLEEEIERTKAIVQISNSIIQVGQLTLEGQKFMHDSGRSSAKLPMMLDE